ncbi:MAG TPA: hypothetical protein VM076_16610 [Gemmatimonadaceae bacterium]|nr:hypothetical protein [Gemmatimonadaceae bacterium]
MSAPVFAQGDSTTKPAAGPPVRRIATASAVSTEQIGSITSVRELPNGRLLLNDGARRRLVLMDTMLTTLGVVLDSLTEVENAYGTRPATIVPYLADSSLFIDQASFAMLVLDPTGKVARVRSIPRVEDASRFGGGGEGGGRSGIDGRGRIVYRIPARPGPPLIPPPKGVPYFPPEPDSAFIVAIDLETRKIDTLGAIRVPKSASTVRRSPNGGFNFYEVMNPMPSTDEWAVLSDGTVAFVRGVDYRVDFRNADGTWTSSPKLPFDWQRVTEEDKQRLIDSVKAEQRRSAMGSYVAQMIRWSNQYGKPYPPEFKAPDGYRVQAGLSRDWKLPPGVEFPANYIYACRAGETPRMVEAPNAVPGSERAGERPADRGGDRGGDRGANRPGDRGANPGGTPRPGERPDFGGRGPGRGGTPPNARPDSAGGQPAAGGPPGGPQGMPSCIPSPVVVSGGNAPPPPTIRESGVMSASELPDYRPPFTSGSVRADADGNLWIRTAPAKPTPGGPVYDIVSRTGELVDRLQLPQGYGLAGFGKGKVVYLSMRDPKGVHLARVRLR